MDQAPILPSSLQSSSSQPFVAEIAPAAESSRTASRPSSSQIYEVRINASTNSFQSRPISELQSSTVLIPSIASTSSAPQEDQTNRENPFPIDHIQAPRPASVSRSILITPDKTILGSLPTDSVSTVVGPLSSSTTGPSLDSLTAHYRALSSTRTGDSTSTSSPSDGDVVSRNPPIIAGIILLGVVFIAAVGSLASWIVRARRRQRNHRLASLGLENESTGNPFDNLQESEASREKLCGERNAFKLPSPGAARTPSFTVQGLGNRSLQEHEGPYPSSFRIANGTGLPFGLRKSRDAAAIPRQNENFGVPRDYVPRFLALEGQGLDHPWMQRPFPLTQEPFPILPTPRTRSPVSALPARRSSKDPIHSTWAISLRSTLSSALEAARQAAGQRTPAATTPSSSAGPSRRSTMPIYNDVFTPMALRPARMSMSRGLPRRDTTEGCELAFASPVRSKTLNSQSTGKFTSTSAALSRRPSAFTRVSRLERSASRRTSNTPEWPTAYSSGLQARPSALSARSRSRSVSGSSVSEMGGEARWRD
ncbi:hypothetical protein PIIN_06818 [Serendipita indica DSM 11827]|uniref:Uncharacterized protein n=1 Tax=Serendipita indica (strain DSM 11827) TaxID=1109443 RepID=G4TNI2_SERID|nr:hypothetical protein PIIN_06818 [Serendipita indica DSM 11827]